MALVTFVDDNPPYINAQNLNNNFNEPKNSMKTITFNNEWLYIHCVSGANMLMLVPIYNPDNSAVTLSLTSSDVYINGAWTTLSVYGTGIQNYGKTFAILRFQNPTGAIAGSTYLMRMKGTLTIGS